MRLPCTRRTALIVDAADRSTPSVSIIAIASALRKSPHTLSVGPALRSISVTSRPARRNCDGGGGAGRPAADDYRAGQCRATQSRNGRCQVMATSRSVRPAARTSRRQSSGTKARAIEMRPSLQHEMMPARRPGEQAEAVIRQPMAMQVADEPAAPRMRLHPTDERHHLVVGEMMGELRADDEVEFFARIDGEHVAGAIGDGRAGIGRVTRRPRRPWIEVHAVKLRAMPRRVAQRWMRRSASPWPQATSSSENDCSPAVSRASQASIGRCVSVTVLTRDRSRRQRR